VSADQHRPFEAPVWRVIAMAIVAASVLYLSAGFLIGVNPDEEDYRHTIPSTIVAAQAASRGELAFWTSDLGLGVPQPFGHSLSMHPLMPLLAVMPVVAWVQLFYLSQLVVAAIGIWLLLRRFGVSALATGVGTATWVLSSPAQNYALTDFWPSAWPVFALMPLLVLAMVAMVDDTPRSPRWTIALGLGLTAGVIGATGHQGYLIVFIPGCVAFLALHARRIARQWHWWLAAAIVAAVIAAPIVLHLSTELALAPNALQRINLTSTLTVDSLWDVFARPFGPSPGDWVRTTSDRGTRVLFFGGPAAALLLLFVIAVRSRLDLCLAVSVSLVPLVVPGLIDTDYLSAILLFRDPVILFGIPCAALALDWTARRSSSWRGVAALLMAAQLVVLWASAWPFLRRNMDAEVKARAPIGHVTGDRPLSSWLRDRVLASPGRLYYSTDVSAMVARGALIDGGLWRNSMFYRGVPLMTASFSGVSTGVLAPDGGIAGQPELVGGDLTLLSLAGVRWVLASEGEAVSPALVERDRRQHGAFSLVLFENPSVSGAAFVDPALRQVRLPRLEGCVHDRLLCADFAPVAALRSTSAVRLDRQGGRIRVAFEPAAGPRLLLVGEMYRDGWHTDEGLAVEPLLGALVGVDVPAGMSAVTLRFRPPLRAALTGASWLTMIGVAAAVFAGLRLRRSVPGLPA
jgi:hypothetical protein